MQAGAAAGGNFRGAHARTACAPYGVCALAECSRLAARAASGDASSPAVVGGSWSGAGVGAGQWPWRLRHRHGLVSAATWRD